MFLNGIDLDRLSAFGEVIADDPSAALVSARVSSEWQQAYQLRANAEDLTVGGQRIPRTTALPVDLPAALGGGDHGPAPGELVLVALTACVSQAFIESAAMAGVAIDRLDVSAEGQLDLRGTAGVEGVRPGLSQIHLDVEVAGDADPGVIDRLLTEALHRSPVADSLRAGVQIGAGLREGSPVS